MLNSMHMKGFPPQLSLKDLVFLYDIPMVFDASSWQPLKGVAHSEHGQYGRTHLCSASARYFFTLFAFVVSYIFREEGGFYIISYLFICVQLQSRRVNMFPGYISVD